METSDKIFFVIGSLFALYGIGGLAVTWLAPKFLNIFPYNRLIAGRLAANNANRTLMSFFYITFGAQMALSAAGYRTLRLIFVVAFIACGIPVFLRRKDA